MSDDDKKKEDKDTLVFRGYDGKVKFAEFDKNMGREMRKKYGTTLGDQFWKNGLPVLQGDDAMSHDQFMVHCEDVLYALTETLQGTNNCTMWAVVSGNEVGTWSGENRNSKGCSIPSPASAREKCSSVVKNME